MAAEARAILTEAWRGDRPRIGAELLAAIRARFAPLGGIDPELPPRGPAREPPRFD